MRQYRDALVTASSELAKALSAATASGQALIPQDLEPALVEELLALQPLLRLMPIIPASGRVHEIARRTAHGIAVAEGAGVQGTGTQGTYDRPTVTLKIHHYWGEVEGFQHAASAKFIDDLVLEQQGGIEAMADLLEFELLYGNATADAYLMDGLDALITTNIFNIANVTATLTHLDNAIDAVRQFRGAQTDPYVWLMSSKMKSKITGLMTYARRTVQTIEFEGGLRMESYFYPIVESSCCAPPATAPASPAAAIATGGSLPNSAYYYKIASVRQNGECIAGAQVTATSGATEHKTNLTWTADPLALLYKIYRGTTTGDANLTLLTTIAARTRLGTGAYDANVAAWTDEGTVVAPTGAANEGPLATGDESIFLVNLNPARGAGLVSLINPLGDRVDNLINYIPLAQVKESYPFLLSCFSALQVPWEKLHAHIRKIKPA